MAVVRRHRLMHNELANIELSYGIPIPERLGKALLDPNDPIHRCSTLLTASDNPLLDAASVNAHLRSIEWKEWPDHLVAFATNECGDYFAFNTRETPYRIYYIGPTDTVPEAIESCDEEGFNFNGFDDWYEHEITDRQTDSEIGGEPNDAPKSRNHGF